MCVRTEYVYAANGTRLQQITNAATTAEEVITYLGPLEIHGFLAVPHQIIAHVRSSVRLVDGVPSYLHRDQLGSVIRITGADGAADDWSGDVGGRDHVFQPARPEQVFRGRSHPRHPGATR